MSRQTAGGARSQQTTPQLSPAQFQPVVHPPLQNSCQQYPGHFTWSLPPLRQLSSTLPTPSDRKHDNTLDVRSVVNPDPDFTEQQRGQQFSGFHMRTIAPRDTQASHSLPSIDRLTGVQDEPDCRISTQPPGGAF
jgi:hypothetical protein